MRKIVGDGISKSSFKFNNLPSIVSASPAPISATSTSLLLASSSPSLSSSLSEATSFRSLRYFLKSSVTQDLTELTISEYQTYYIGVDCGQRTAYFDIEIDIFFRCHVTFWICEFFEKGIEFLIHYVIFIFTCMLSNTTFCKAVFDRFNAALLPSICHQFYSLKNANIFCNFWGK